MENTQALNMGGDDSERQRIESAALIWDDGKGRRLHKDDGEFFFSTEAGKVSEVVYSDAILWLRESHPLVKVVEATGDLHLGAVKENGDFAFYDAAFQKMLTLPMTAEAVSSFLTERGKMKGKRRRYSGKRKRFK